MDHIVTAQKLDGTVHSLAVVGNSDKHDISFVKSVTYFGRGNPLNVWDKRFELFIDNDFRSYLNEGFKTLLFLFRGVGFRLRWYRLSTINCFLRGLNIF